LLNNKLTTPKPITLNRYLRDLIKQNIQYASIEVSSQGIDLHRIDHLTFQVAIFTNLTHEHLDYHKTIENYFQTKLKLFQILKEDHYAIVNLDASPYADQIIEATKAKLLTYGQSIHADFKISQIHTTLDESTFDLMTPIGLFRNIKLNLFGDYNVYNATASLAALYALGFPLEQVILRLNNLKPIDGRMHVLECGQPFKVIVDFAHTPNALNTLLRNINQFKNRDLTVVFGSAGERDVSKRPLMGEAVNRYASRLILTNEDPKSEDSLDIIYDILEGVNDPFKVSIIPNRKQAIIKALNEANTDDIVLITGKGNEKIQVFNGYIEDHNDIAIAESFLHKKYQPQYIYSIANM